MGIVITNSYDRIPLTQESAKKYFSALSKKDLTHTVEREIDGNPINIMDERSHFKDKKQGQAIVVQVMPTFECNHDCSFCVEDATARFHRTNTSNEEYSEYVDKIIRELNEQNISPSITITGGEPLLNFDRLSMVLDKIKDNKKINYGINTNGTFLRDPRYIEMLKEHFDTGKFHVNISRHHYDDNINKKLFGKGVPLTVDELSKINEQLDGKLHLQLVLNKNGINNIDEIKKYLDTFVDKGFKRITIRSLVKMDKVVGASAAKINYNNDSQVDMTKILDEVSKDDDFEFVKQDIEAYFDDEFYNYKGALVKFVYTDMSCAEEVERKSKELGKQLTTLITIMPDKALYGSWNYQNSPINSAAAIDAYSNTAKASAIE